MNIGIPQKNLEKITTVLNGILSDTFVLYAKTRNYHWNVTGPNFSELHKFFEAQYETLDESMDETAERVRALGGRAFGTLAEFVRETDLKEKPGTSPDAKTMIADLLSDHETVIRKLRGAVEECDTKYGDAGTADFLTGLLEQHEKMAWMLRSF